VCRRNGSKDAMNDVNSITTDDAKFNLSVTSHNYGYAYVFLLLHIKITNTVGSGGLA